RLDRGFLPDGPRDDDERDVEAQGLDHPERGEAAEPGDQPVAEDGVPGPALERRPHGCLVVDALDGDVREAAAELAGDQLGVGRVVLDVQDAERAAHVGPRYGGADSFTRSQKSPSVLAASTDSPKSTGLSSTSRIALVMSPPRRYRRSA